MLKRTITYTDYDDVVRTEDFYFNLTKTEATEIELGTDGGMTKRIEQIIAAKDTKRILTIFKDMILLAYGEKSPDGRRFVKSKEISEAFSQTPAYDILFQELTKDTEAVTAFVNGIIPQA